MYIVKEILVDGELYISSSIDACAGQRISTALITLESRAREYVKKEFGMSAYRDAKIIDIHDISQVNEPLNDGVLLYRLESDPHKIMVYRKKTSTVNLSGWVSSYESSKSIFGRIIIFELEDCSIIEGNNVTETEMVSVGKAGISIPIQYTVAPGRDLIDELKKSERFKNLRSQIDDI
jgi:hypothetical protein